jgi:DNA-binding transcriptional LysR family regulator
MDWTLDQLRAIDAIETTGTFAGAAAVLHKVPSAVSYSVRTLEDVLGFSVFERARPVRLTPGGRRILNVARRILRDAESLDRVAAELRAGWEPELRVVVDGALPMSSVLRCLRRFGDPDVPTALRLDVEYQEGVLERFADGADIALVLGLSEDGPGDGYAAVPLATLEMVLVAAPSHPLASGPADAEARKGHAEIVVRDSSPRFERESKASFLGSTNLVYLSDFHSKRQALLEGAGWGWVPEHFVSADLKAGTLQLLPSEPNRWMYRPSVVTRTDQPTGRAATLFLETLLG